MKSLIKNKNKGILFWITGLSGSGKTSLARKIIGYISKMYGPTIMVSGDDLRKIFNLNSFSKKNRLIYALSYSEFCRKLTNQKINVLISTVSLFKKVRKQNRKYIENYIEIYIKADIRKIIKQRNKFFYKIKTSNVYGKDIKPEFPTSSHIIIKNNFNKTVALLSKELINKIEKIT